jgi:PleD family two-component response regulator
MSEPTTAPVTDPRVLFVDDEATIRYSFQRAMQRRGFAVDVAESGAAAIEMASRAPYAVVATDLNMPGMNGIQLVEQLHRSSPEASFVLVTGANELDLPTESESARAITCIIQKPWDAAHMADALQRATELHVVRRETRDQAVPRRNGVAVLLVEDTPNDARLVRAMLAPTPRDVYAVTHVQRLAQALVALESQPFDVVLVDLSLADARGMDAVARLQAVRESVPIIVMSSECDEDLAQQVVQRGAQDYIVKGDMNAALLRRSLHYAVERKSTEERLASLAHFDQLTGLANRTQFGRRVGRALVRAKQSGSHPAVLFLDLDRFKAVNDTLGHAAGDQLLREVARRLSQTVRSSDTVARLGGDDAVVLVPRPAVALPPAMPVGPDQIRQRIVIRRAGPTLTGGHDFGFLKAKTSNVAQPTGGTTVVENGPLSLSGVFDDAQIVFLGNGVDRIHVGDFPPKVDRQDRPRFRRDGGFDFRRVDVVRFRIDVDVNRQGEPAENAGRRGDEGVWRGDHFVPWADPARFKGDFEGGRSAVERQAVLNALGSGEFPLELLDLGDFPARLAGGKLVGAEGVHPPLVASQNAQQILFVLIVVDRPSGKGPVHQFRSAADRQLAHRRSLLVSNAPAEGGFPLCSAAGIRQCSV